MTAAIGNDAVFVPVLPSFDSFFTDLSKGAKKGGERAGKDMAGAMEKELRSAEKLVDRTAATQERAQNRAADAADKTRLAQIKLSEALDDSSVSSSKLADLTAKYEKAARDQTTADKAAERAVSAHEKAQNDLRKATDESEDSVSQSAAGLEDYEGALDKATGGVKNFLGAAAGFAGIAGIGATIASGMDISGAVSAMNREIGLTGDAATALGDEVSEVMRGGVSASVEDATGAIGALHSQFGYLGSEGEQTAAELSDNFLAFSKTFEVDLAESTQVAGQLIKNNLAPDVETAADLMTVAMQRVPQAMRGEMMDAINEYGVNFSNLGYTGEEAFSLLVGAAEGGQYAIDKTGDAIKEFSVLAIDPAKAEVFESLGINAEKAASNVAVGGDVARETLEETARALLDMEDPGARAAAAVELFGAPIEDLGVDQIPGFLENLSGMQDGMAGAAGASQDLADQMANSLSGRMNALKGTVQSLAGDAFMYVWDVVQDKLIPAFQDFGEWVQRNATWLTPLAVGLGTMAGIITGLVAAIKIWNGVMTVYRTVQALATGQTLLFNSALLSNPITWVVAAIAGLIAALVWFFTQTEIGQEIWGKFTDALATGWGWVVDKVGGGIDWIVDKFGQFTDWISTAWSGITSLFAGDYTGDLRDAFGIEEDSAIIAFFFTVRDVIVGAIDWIKDAWTWLGDAISATYENVIKPVFDGFVTAGKILFAVLATAVLTPIKIAWNLLSAAFMWGWENMIKPAWDGISSFATETLWPILQSVFGFITNAWSMLSTGIQWYYENVILTVWSALQTAATWMWQSVLQPIFGFIGTAWSALASGIQWYYENVILVAWSALQTAAMFMWQNVLMPVFGWIQTGWQVLSDAIQWMWQNVILVAWTALQNAATWMYENVLRPVFQWIGDRWSDLSNAIRWAYDNIIQPAWDALSSALTWMYENVVQPVMQWMGDRWTDMANVLEAGKTFIVDSVFGGLQRGLDVVKSAFELARDAIGRAWDGIKEKAAAPVKFVIDTVFNDGIVEVWNKVAGWVGLDPIDKYEPAWLGDYARGTASIVPGARSVGRDNVNFISTDGRYGIGLAGGEGIAHQYVVDGIGGKPAWDRLNYVARTRGPGAVREELGSDKGHYKNYLGGFSQGGVIDSIVGLVNQYFPGMGISSTIRPGENNHHGWGEAVDVSNTGAGMPSTPEMQAVARFFHDNYAPMLAELIHWPLNGWQNIDEGVPFDFGPATNAGHTDHVHIASRTPLPPPGTPIDPIMVGSGGGSGVVNWLRNRVADVIDSIFNPIAEMIPTGDGIIGQLPKAAFEKMTGAVSDFLRGKAGTSSGGVDTSGVVGSNLEIGEQLAAQVGWVGSEWEALKELWTLESNWNNHAQNPTSTAYGIPQFLDQTWATVGYEKTSDPATQIAAGIKYIQGRPDYGGLPSNALAAWWSRNPHWYDQGGEARGIGFLPKNVIEPERVLSPEMTRAFNDWMRGNPHAESALVVARELASAFAGEDWGYGELASYIGADLAESTIEVVKAVGRADRGFREWAAADEERGRMGSPQEWALHYGAQAAATAGDDLLGLVGLGGIIGSTPNESLLDLLQVGAQNLNDVYGWDLPVLSGEELQPMAVIDDDGRVIGTVIEEADIEAATAEPVEVAETVDTAVATATRAADEAPAPTTAASASASEGRQIVLQIEGDAVSVETLQKAADDLSERLGDVTIRVEKLEGQMVASVVSGVAAGIV